MTAALWRRGPDDEGIWTDEAAGIALGHRRLAILDLSPAGHQPMSSASGRYVLVFNGEIYNHLELRQRLTTSQSWQGHSDTETLLACIEAWGLEVTLQRSVGMFALAVWDQQTRQLALARDRMGEKPLYYGWQGSTFLFASELKALQAYPLFNAEINRDALTLLLRYNYILAPFSIYTGIYKLSPGTFLNIPFGQGITQAQGAQPVSYWSLLETALAGTRESCHSSEAELLTELEQCLGDAVAGQQLADVPLGAFLSGGIDSSLIVALMQARSPSRAVQTFTIGFSEAGYNEAEHARAVAQHLHTEHTELYVSAAQALQVIPLLPTLYDEPYSDSSQIPTYLVAQLARQHVTVALSGDGGDEVFGGYTRYTLAAKIWRTLGWLPMGVRSGLGKLMTALPISTLNHLGRTTRIHALLGEKMHKLGPRLCHVRNMEEFYLSLLAGMTKMTALVCRGSEPETLLTRYTDWPDLQPFELRMMYLDTMTYLPDDILCKVDRAAMGVSLETRAPFLDHRVVELAWRLPLRMKIRHGQGKWALRQLLYKHVPRKLLERPKQGFGIPLAEWLRGPLRDWAEELLHPNRLHKEGYFNPAPILQRWQELLTTGKRNWEYSLWSVLMFQAWLAIQQGKG